MAKDKKPTATDPADYLSRLSAFQLRIHDHKRAGTACVAVVTAEERRLIADLPAIAQATGTPGHPTDVYVWSAITGLCLVYPTQKTMIDGTTVLPGIFDKIPKDAIVAITDAQEWPYDSDPMMNRGMRLMIDSTAAKGSMLILVGPTLKLPPTIEKQVQIVDFDMPDEIARTKLVKTLTERWVADTGMTLEGDNESTIAAISGLTFDEASNALGLALVETNKFDPEVVFREKTQAVKRQGVLQVLEPAVGGLSGVGGLGELKTWLQRRERAFTKEARDFGLPIPLGILVVGPPGCLHGDTVVQYLRGTRNSGRDITLGELFKKFHGIPTRTRPWVDLTVPTYLHSLGPDGDVYYNRIVSITEAGVKPLVRVDFTDGTSLRLTPDHPVCVPGGSFSPAQDLVPGMTVLGRGSMKPVGDGGRNLAARPPRVIVNNKYHPRGGYHAINGYSYKRTARAVLVIEAHMNNMPYDEYVHCLRSNEELAATLKYIPEGFDVHHIDEDTMNDDMSNLMVMLRAEHSREHSKRENFNVEYVRELTVHSISAEPEAMTYDVQMETPANNFVAEGVIVHNTGKSLVAKATGAALGGIPILRLDVGSLFGGIVGATEEAVRKTLKQVDAMEPCVLFIDEVDKALAGANGSANDGGVTRRLFGSLLTWLQEKKTAVFVVVTANDVTGIPPEFMRKGRFDELWFVDLPTPQEREEIFGIHLRKHKRDPTVYDLKALAAASPDFVGAEIAAAVGDGLYDAFDMGTELTTEHIVGALKRTVPLAKTAEESIKATRAWATNRARPASKGAAPMLEELAPRPKFSAGRLSGG